MTALKLLIFVAFCSQIICGKRYDQNDFLYMYEDEAIDINDEDWNDDLLWSRIDTIETVYDDKIVRKCIYSSCLCQYSYTNMKYACSYQRGQQLNAEISDSNFYDYYDEMAVGADQIKDDPLLKIAHNLFEFVVEQGQLLVKLPNFNLKKSGGDPYDQTEYFAKPIIWTEYVDKFNDGSLTLSKEDARARAVDVNFIPETIKALRVVTKNEFLKDIVKNVGVPAGHDGGLFDDQKQCFENMGSDTFVSDYDFSYVRWDAPHKEIDYFIAFTNSFETIYGKDSPTVFDMNFYIVTAFVNSVCLGTFRRTSEIAQLFRQLGEHDIYEFIPATRYDSGLVSEYDHFMTYILVKNRLRYLAQGYPHPEVDVVKRLKYGEIFYYILSGINSRQIAITDDTKFYLKVLKNQINYYSDESYISNQALMLIVFGQNRDQMKGFIDEKGVYVACLDNFVFIQGYYNAYQGDYLKFWNKASKYIMRIGHLLNFLDGFGWIFPSQEISNQFVKGKNDNLYFFAKEWNTEKKFAEFPELKKRKIRGDIALEHISSTEDTNDPLLIEARIIWKAITTTKCKYQTLLQMWTALFRTLLDIIEEELRLPFERLQAAEVRVELDEMSKNVHRLVTIQKTPLQIQRPQPLVYNYRNVWTELVRTPPRPRSAPHGRRADGRGGAQVQQLPRADDRGSKGAKEAQAVPSWLSEEV